MAMGRISYVALVRSAGVKVEFNLSSELFQSSVQCPFGFKLI